MDAEVQGLLIVAWPTRKGVRHDARTVSTQHGHTLAEGIPAAGTETDFCPFGETIPEGGKDMKTKFSQATLLVGLALGLMALWAGATPLAGIGDGGVGGEEWYPCYAYFGIQIGTADLFWNGMNCRYCYGTHSEPCSDFYDTSPEPCRGGSISVADCGDETAAGTTYAEEGPAPCWSWYNTDCSKNFDAWCDI